MTGALDRLLWEEAAVWYARMQEPESEQEVARFEAWLASDPAHARAYTEMNVISEAGAAAAPRLAEPLSPSSAMAWRPVLAAAALVAVFATTVLAWQGFSAPAFASVSNPGAAVRGVRLRDGTEMWLDAGAEVGVQIDDAHRTIDVRKGRVRIRPVAGEPPLSVIAGGVTVDPGTAQLDVAIDEEKVAVSALGGRLSLSSEGGQEFAVESGTGLVVDPSGAHDTAIDRTWPVARLRFVGAELGRIVAIANRQAGPDIVFSDPETATRTVTGVLDLRDTRRLARKLAAAHDLQVRDAGRRLVLFR